ncbi:hypothetical protein PMAYCL1PPCAC_09598, partial [Pristionchus mayeri]
GEIAANYARYSNHYFVTAQLPPGYYDNKKIVGESADVHTLEERIKECRNSKGNELSEMQRMKQLIKELEESEVRWAKEKKKLMMKQVETDKEGPFTVPAQISSFEMCLDECCCAICSENFESIKTIPRNLECGHTFCEVCIYSMSVEFNVICPNCKIVTSFPTGKALPRNFAMISMAEQMMKSKLDPKITCKACNSKFSSEAVRMCVGENCEMLNQLICFNCVIDGGHAQH